MTIVCVVELDDRTHDEKKDQLRDAMTNSAGIKTIRWLSKAKPEELEIAQTIERLSLPVLAPQK